MSAKEKLGVSYASAIQRLMRDIIYDYAKKNGQLKCFRCGEDISRQSFSIEHKIPWGLADNPYNAFYDLDNISYSHFDCNAEHGRKASHDASRARREELFADGKSWCPRCQDSKNLSEFNFSFNNWNKVSTYCRECNRAKGREKYALTK